MHLAHRPGRPDEHRHAAGQQLRPIARLAVRGGGVKAFRPDKRCVVVVQAADVDLDRAVERLAGDEVQHPAEGEGIGGLRHDRGGSWAQQDDVVEGATRIGEVLDLDRGVPGALPNRRDQGVRKPRQHDLARAVQDAVERVRPLVAGTTDDPCPAALRRRQPSALGVGRLDAGPRFGQCRLRVAQAVVDRDDVRAVIGREHLRPDHVIADQPAGDRVAVGGAATIDIDVRLDGQPLARLEPATQLVAHVDHRDGGLVPKARGLARQVATVELRVLAAQADQLDVREAQAHGVDPDEELVRGGARHPDRLRMPVATHRLDPLAVDVPGERLRRRLRQRLVGGVTVGDLDHVGHFGRGRSAFFSTRPVWSMIPTFVPIVSGLAENRSPALIATQR